MVDQFNASIEFDKRLYPYDIKGSIAHCRMLAKQGIISDKEADNIINALKEKNSSLQTQIDTKTNQYSNMLLEKIANQKKEFSILDSSASSVKIELDTLRQNLVKNNKLLDKVNSFDDIKEFELFLNFISSHSSYILDTYAHTLKFYHLKSILNILYLLFPTWFLFYFLYRFLLKQKYMITSHLAVNVANVAALFIAGHLFILIYEVIPHVFLQKIIILFSEHNLTVLLNVFGLLTIMTIFGGFIYKIQRNRVIDDDNNKHTLLLQEKFTWRKKGNCTCCGFSNSFDNKFCRECGTSLIKTCPHCDSHNNINNKFCINCSETF
jgi:hypothetical protein